MRARAFKILLGVAQDQKCYLVKMPVEVKVKICEMLILERGEETTATEYTLVKMRPEITVSVCGIVILEGGEETTAMANYLQHDTHDTHDTHNSQAQFTTTTHNHNSQPQLTTTIHNHNSQPQLTRCKTNPSTA